MFDIPNLEARTARVRLLVSALVRLEQLPAVLARGSRRVRGASLLRKIDGRVW